MVKQSLGVASANFRLRPDTRAHVMHYPQEINCRNAGYESTKFDERPGGQNFVVAIVSHHGYNMQDAVIMNKASVERALGRSAFIRTYNAENKRFPGDKRRESRFRDGSR